MFNCTSDFKFIFDRVCVQQLIIKTKYTVNDLKSDSYTKVGQTEKVCMILIIMNKQCHTHHCDNLKNSLDVTKYESDFIKKVKFLCVGN